MKDAQIVSHGFRHYAVLGVVLALDPCKREPRTAIVSNIGAILTRVYYFARIRVNTTSPLHSRSLGGLRPAHKRRERPPGLQPQLLINIVGMLLDIYFEFLKIKS